MRLFVLFLLYFVSIKSADAGNSNQELCSHSRDYVCDYCPDAYLYMNTMEKELEKIQIDQRINLLIFWLRYNGFLGECVSPPELVLKDQRSSHLEGIRKDIMYLNVCEQNRGRYVWSQPYRISLLKKLYALRDAEQ